MRLPLVPAIIIMIIGVFIDLYIFRCIKTRARNHRRFWETFQAVSALILNIGIITFVALPRRSGSDAQLVAISWALLTYISVYIPKLIFVIIDLIASIPKLFHHKRVTTITIIGIAAAIITCLAVWWGATVNRNRVSITQHTITIPELPASFEGYRIVQISDLHVGSYGTNTAYLEKLVGIINALHPDLIVFTGDIVNRRTSELEPFTDVLSRLSAPDGVISILGNHDYGNYSSWASPAAKQKNLQRLKQLQAAMGWKLLLDKTIRIQRGDSAIEIIGVENIGEPPFPTYGSLRRAHPSSLDTPTTKILLTHNPKHWTNEIAGDHEKKIALTLSGHTHAMQLTLGRFSPARYVYPTWGGLYQDNDPQYNHQLYVNIGVGTVGLPMRIGATPEVTLLTLRK